MGVRYQAVTWNRAKWLYDFVLVFLVAFYLIVFIQTHIYTQPETSLETVLIRAFGTAAMILLHVILVIGPLCRLDPRFLPLLYNRRHMGVVMFVLALVHAVLVLIQYHALGDVDPFVSVLVGNTRIDDAASFPFQPFGLAALVILFLMAATSHDFWLNNLTAPIWKALHMSVYVAYLLLVAHVVFGIAQSEAVTMPLVLLGMGMAVIILLHLVAGFKDRVREPVHGTEYVEVCLVSDIPEDRAKIVVLGGERVAVFKHQDHVFALSNVCRHQNGPLGEGKVIDGCVVCPWHGWQYRGEDGRSPKPFTEKVPTFNVQLRAEHVLVHPIPNPPGTAADPAPIL